MLFVVIVVSNQSLDGAIPDVDQDETPDDDSHDDHNSNSGFYDNNATAEAPRFTKRLLPMLVKPAGNMVRMKCPAEGNPVPNITWYKNDKTPIVRNLGGIRTTKWQMLLEDLITADSGNYTCVVCNIKGCINFTYKLEIVGKFVSIHMQIADMIVSIES